MSHLLTSISGSGGIRGLVFATIALVAASPVISTADNPADPAFIWGPTANGLRCRIVPVSTEMSEDAIHLDKPQSKFQNRNEVAFAVEVENVSNRPIKLLDTRHQNIFGRSSGKVSSDRYSQVLFDIEYFDRTGRRIPKPLVMVIDRYFVIGDMAVAGVEPGRTHRFLLRPSNWRSALSQRLPPGKYRAVVKYCGLPAATADVIRQYCDDCDLLDAWSGNLASPPADFDIAADPDPHPRPLAWGRPSDAIRAALELIPNCLAYAYGEQLQAKLHLQNVSDKAISFTTQLSQPNLEMLAVDAHDQPAEINANWQHSRPLVCRITLDPQQTVIIDAGNLAMTANSKQANAFGDVINRKLVADPGRYTLRFADRFFGEQITKIEDAKGNQLAPLEGDWTGSLETGPLKILVAKAVVPDPKSNDAQTSAVPVFERPVSLRTNQMTIEEALQNVCRQAGVPLELDRDALANLDVDLQTTVNVNFRNAPLGKALTMLLVQIAPLERSRITRELNNGRLLISTSFSLRRRTREQLPDWMKPLFTRGIWPTLDDNNNIIEVSLSRDFVTDEHLARLVELPKLRALGISRARNLTKSGIAVLAQLKNLETLEVYDLQQDDGLGDDLIRSVVGLKSLRAFLISECGTTDAGAKLLEQMPQLTRLRLYQEGRLTDAAISAIAALKNLKNLDLTSNVATERYGWMRFSPAALRKLSALEQLEILDLQGQNVPPDALAFPKLKALSLSGEHVDDEFALLALAKYKSLQSLSLSGTQIGNKGLLVIASLPELRELTVSAGPLTDAGLAYLQHCRRLEHLALFKVNVTDVGIRHLAAIKSLRWIDLSAAPGATVAGLGQLKQLPELRTLYLHGFQERIGYEALTELVHLRELHFEMCALDVEQYRIIREGLPQTNIKYRGPPVVRR